MSEATCTFCGRSIPPPADGGPAVCLRCRNSRLTERLDGIRTNLLAIDRLPPEPADGDDRGEDDLPPDDDSRSSA